MTVVIAAPGASRAVRARVRDGDRRPPPRSLHRDGAVRAPGQPRRVLAAGHRHRGRAARARLGRRGRVQLAGPAQLSPVGRCRVPACAPPGALAGRRDRRRDGLRVLAVPSGARRLSPAHRADPVDAAVPARAVAVSRQRLAAGGRLPCRRDGRRDAVELLRRPDRRGHHAGCRGRVLDRHAPDAALAIRGARLWHHGREPAGHRRLPGSPTRRTPPAPSSTDRAAFAFPRADLFRYSAKWWSYLVPPVEHPLLGAHARSALECGGRPRGTARTAGQPRVGDRRARRSSPSVAGLRRDRAAGVARARSGPRHRRRRRARVLAVARADDRRRSPSSGLRRFCTTSLPMFRSYARFGVVVQLMAALLAGIGRGISSAGRDQASADRVRCARRARRRRVRGRAVGAVARRASDGGAPLGRATGRAASGSSTARRSIRSRRRCSG